MGLATPGYVENRLTVNLCLIGQHQLGHNDWQRSKHIHSILMPSLIVSTWNRNACDSFETWRGPLYMAILSESPKSKDRRDNLNTKYVNFEMVCSPFPV